MSLKSIISSAMALAIIIIISIFNVARAAEKVIASVSQDESKTTYKLIVDSTDGRTIRAFYKDVYENSVKIRRDLLDPSIIMKSGMILEQRDKHVLMKLVSHNYDSESGGIVTIDTLYNGATGERKTYDIQLAQDNKAGWALYKEGRGINQILIQTNRVMVLGAVGIKNLVMK